LRNDDGGFAHGIEPDARTPHSQPLGIEMALRILHEADVWDADLVGGALDLEKLVIIGVKHTAPEHPSAFALSLSKPCLSLPKRRKAVLRQAQDEPVDA